MKASQYHNNGLLESALPLVLSTSMEDVLKMIKDAFLFHALFCFISFLFLFWFSRYLNVCPDFFGYVVKKFMTSKIGKQIIAVHILSNISISKSNQTMEFGQLIECNMRNIFLEKSCTKYDGETNSRPFSEKLKLSISLDQQSKVLYSLFLLYVKLRVIETY